MRITDALAALVAKKIGEMAALLAIVVIIKYVTHLDTPKICYYT
jgi:hypothetical protein